MVLRKVAGLVLAAGVLVSVAGCSFNPKPESLQSYAPSDGVGTELSFGHHNLQTIKVRNLLIVTDGTQTNLYGTLINDGKAAQSVVLQVTGDSTKSQTVEVKAGQTYVFDQNNKSTIPLAGKAGETVKMTLVVDNGKEQANLDVPVLDGTIDYYKNLLTPTPTATN